MNAIVKAHNAGLFSIINSVVTCLSLFDNVHVDWSEGCIYGDAWSTLFAPTEMPSQPYEVVTNFWHQLITYKNAGRLYQTGDRWRRHFRESWNRLTIQPTMLAMVRDFLMTRQLPNNGFVSVLVRAHTHAGEQLTNRSQTLGEYAAEVCAAIKPGEKLFVMAGDIQTAEWFAERFPLVIVMYPHTRRSTSRDVDRHLHEPQTIEDAVNCFVETMILAKSRVLIHPVSNIATCALYVNPWMKSVYLA